MTAYWKPQRMDYGDGYEFVVVTTGPTRGELWYKGKIIRWDITQKEAREVQRVREV